MTKSIWGLHMAKIDASAPVKGGFVGIGWEEMGDLSGLRKNRDAFKARLVQVYPSEKPGAVPVMAGVLYRFVCEMAVGDIVVYPSKPDRMVHLGVIEGDYSFDPACMGQYPWRLSRSYHRQRIGPLHPERRQQRI